MADEADVAQKEIDFALKTALSKAKPKMPFIGECYECGEHLNTVDGEAPALFCGAECRDMYEKRERMRRINGTS